MAATRDQIIDYNFEWDPKKAQKNLKKHGVGFEQATQVFIDPLALTVLDETHSEDEERWITMGKANDSLLVVVHTFQEVSQGSTQIRITQPAKQPGENSDNTRKLAYEGRI